MQAALCCGIADVISAASAVRQLTCHSASVCLAKCAGHNGIFRGVYFIYSIVVFVKYRTQSGQNSIFSHNLILWFHLIVFPTGSLFCLSVIFGRRCLRLICRWSFCLIRSFTVIGCGWCLALFAAIRRVCSISAAISTVVPTWFFIGTIRCATARLFALTRIAVSISGTIRLTAATSRSDICIAVLVIAYILKSIIFLICTGAVTVVRSSQRGRIFRFLTSWCFGILDQLFLRKCKKLIFLSGTLIAVFILICKICILTFSRHIVIFVFIIVILKPAEILRFKHAASS